MKKPVVIEKCPYCWAHSSARTWEHHIDCPIRVQGWGITMSGYARTLWQSGYDLARSRQTLKRLYIPPSYRKDEAFRRHSFDIARLGARVRKWECQKRQKESRRARSVSA